MFSSRSYEGVLEAAQRQNNLLNSIRDGALDLRRGDALGAMDKVQAHDEDTQGSGSGSGFSDLSALENETDEFGRLLLQHQRDARRLNNATRGQQAFRKARPHPRIAERLEREERENERNGVVGGQNHERPGSGGSNDSDPPVTVPREWGRRARKQTDWLRKITALSENGEERATDRLKASGEEIHQRNISYAGEVDWEDGAEEVLQSIENNTPPSMRRGRYTATPSSLNHMNTTLRPFVNSEDQDQDFTSNSLLTSTPAPVKYYRKIDELARREIEELETQAVTTRALDQINQQIPNAALRRTSSSKLRERAIADGLLSPPMSAAPSAANSRSPSRIPVRRQNGISNKENVPFNSDANDGSKDVEANGTAQPANTKKLPKPAHQRSDSMSLLKKLARVSSMSPSPARSRAGSDPIDEPDNPDVNGDSQPIQTKTTSNDELKQAKVIGVGEQVNQTPVPQGQALEPRTPVVTGAWVDTTLNADAQPPPAGNGNISKPPTSSEDAELRQTKNVPARPTSALDAIIHEAKHHPGVQQFGESTIQSLEDIVHPNMDPTETSMTFDSGALANGHRDDDIDDGRPLTQMEKDRRQEALAMEAMNKHLRTARTSIKDANRGLRRVENRIDTVQDRSIPSDTKPVTVHRKHGNVQCAVCGGGYQSVWKALWMELLSCFYTWDASSKYRIRFTWLGLACLLWLTWYLSESTLCAYYCKPMYAERVIGKIDPDAPVFPFVIPTLIFRPLRWLWKPACDMLAEGLGVVFHSLFGDSSTSADPPPLAVNRQFGSTLKRTLANTAVTRSEWMASATAASARVVQSLVDAVDEVGSMWDDEYL